MLLIHYMIESLNILVCHDHNDMTTSVNAAYFS